MKKLLIAFLVFNMIFAFAGCTRRMNGNGTPVTDDQNQLNSGDFVTTVPQGIPNTDNGITTTRTDTDTRVNNANTPYATSLGTLDGTLRDSINGLKPVTYNANDKNYFSNQATYYSQKAAAYKKALDSAQRLSYTGNTRANHDAVIAYYKSGYDTYSNLAAKYQGFKTVDDENAYRNGVGRNTFDLAPKISDAYERAIKSIGIKR